MSNRISLSHTMSLPFQAETIWPLLCPVREYDWIEPWKCELVFSESGTNELGSVFRTEFPNEGDLETWTTSRYEPPRRLEFVRTNSWRTILLGLELSPTDEGTALRWSQQVTALNGPGQEYLKQKPESFGAQMEMLERMLLHFLKTGERLSLEKDPTHHVYHR